MNRKFWFFLVGMVSLFAAPVLAAEGDLAKLGAAIGAGIAIGVAALGGGIGQGRLVAGALEGIARNPNASDRMFVPMILTRGGGPGPPESLHVFRNQGAPAPLMLLGPVSGNGR